MAHRPLWKPVPVGVIALIKRTAVTRAHIPVMLPLRDPVLSIRRPQELVDRREPAPLG